MIGDFYTLPNRGFTMNGLVSRSYQSIQVPEGTTIRTKGPEQRVGSGVVKMVKATHKPSYPPDAESKEYDIPVVVIGDKEYRMDNIEVYEPEIVKYEATAPQFLSPRAPSS
jgi:hypothetical protein